MFARKRKTQNVRECCLWVCVRVRERERERERERMAIKRWNKRCRKNAFCRMQLNRASWELDKQLRGFCPPGNYRNWRQFWKCVCTYKKLIWSISSCPVTLLNFLSFSWLDQGLILKNIKGGSRKPNPTNIKFQKMFGFLTRMCCQL